jgi:hypothetical protein
MCSKVTCRQCTKATWSECGEHIEEALAGIPIADRCQGHEAQVKKSGIFSKLFSR